MNNFLSCDWGTSTLRLNLLDGNNGAVLCREISDEGIARVYARWQISGQPESSRVVFYLHVLQQYISSIELKIGSSLANCPLVISGMASSSVGLMELPYSELPFSLSGDGLYSVTLPPSAAFMHEITLLSGIKSANDVMRGEETQLIGCHGAGNSHIRNEVFVFPGTHSKHLYISQDQVISFSTYMTGEFFELLSQKSLLAASLEPDGEIERPANLKSFMQGVGDAAGSNLLHTAFQVRTNRLFDIFTKKQNFHYLSGLLIGTELGELRSADPGRIHLICGSNLNLYYQIAFTELGLCNKLQIYPQDWANDAVPRAHYLIYRQTSTHGK